jgi:hypothetical protein
MTTATASPQKNRSTPWFSSPRWTKYVVHDDGWIYADGAKAPMYVVTGDDDLPTHFARVMEPPGLRVDAHVPALRDFCERFGLLGYTTLTGPRAVKGLGRTKGRREVRQADLICWALRHAANVRLILALHRGAQGWAELDAVLAQLAHWQIPLTTKPWQKPLGLALSTLRREHSPLEGGRRVLAALLQPNVEQVARAISTTPGEPHFPFRLRALIDAIYWQLADAVEGHVEVRQCECGALFFARDPRQHSCPKLPGQRESRCTKRFRMRHLRHPSSRKNAHGKKKRTW